jgi:crossover junction endodeoxyribonuclease RuvC
MRLLALDIATTTGFCIGGPGGEPRFGSFRLPTRFTPDDLGGKGAAFSNWLSDLITVEQPTLISFEAPIPPRGTMKTNVQTIRLLLGLAFEAEVIAYMRDVECFEANVQTARKAFTGSGRSDKNDVIAACVKKGWKVADDHQADAGAIWHYEMALRQGRRTSIEHLAGRVA